MRKLTRTARWLAGLTVVGVAMAAGDGALFVVGRAAQNDSLATDYSIYNGQVAAAADREQVGTEVDVGFNGGAVNNFYPLARVDVAVAGTNAAASPADTGPLAQAVFAGQNITQPQYVFAQYPGAESPPAYTAGSANASASVTPASAVASATYAAAGNTATAPLGGSSAPDGIDGGTAKVSSYFDPTLGFVTIGDSRVQHASFGNGMLVIDGLHVTVRATTTGSDTFAKDVSITMAGASITVNGVTVPVTIDQNGVTVAQNQITPLDQVQAVSAQLNSALAAAGLSVHAVAPQETQQGDDLHLEAVGVVVDYEQTGTPSGVPRQFVRHTLGDVVMDNEAVTAPPPPEAAAEPLPTDLGTAVAPSTAPTNVTTAPTTAPAAPPPATPRATAPARIGAIPVSVVLTQPKPRWLLLAYLAWQALMIALAGALYLHRSALRRIT